ncbi:MAG: hypothetical protein GY749_00240 [Desulfobacteraceae bacterium]|nr:hypothetical protein [Desulfobacteraceae bacterium]
MSGEKRTYVSVEQRELRRLREQDSRLRSLQHDLPERLNAFRQQAEREMQTRIAPIEARQQQYENMVRGLESNLAHLERETQQRLQGQHNEFMGRLNKHRGEYLRLFEKQDSKFASMIAAEQEERQQAVNHLQSRISVIVADADRKQNAARSFVADLAKIMEDAGGLPHQRFAPGQLDAVSRHVEDAQRSVDAGMPEAGLSTAQKAYWDVADMRVLGAKKKPDTIPVIIYPSRDHILDYLGYRHITGIKEWESLAKTKYLHKLYQRSEESAPDKKCKELARIIGLTVCEFVPCSVTYLRLMLISANLLRLFINMAEITLQRYSRPAGFQGKCTRNLAVCKFAEIREARLYAALSIWVYLKF